MAELHGIGTTIPSGDGAFLPKHVELFQEEDRSAARAVIMLMFGVFSLGLMIFAIVCYSVWPHG